VRVDVVGAILRVVFNDKDEGVVRVNAPGNLLDQQADRIVVIGFLKLRSIYKVNGGAKTIQCDRARRSNELKEGSPPAA